MALRGNAHEVVRHCALVEDTVEVRVQIDVREQEDEDPVESNWLMSETSFGTTIVLAA
jgi:hypothetical protein